jgi:hypothetical protein
MNGPELRNQSLKLGVPDPRESKTAWRCPAVAALGAEGPGMPNGVGARRGPPPGLSCSQLVHGTAHKGLRRAGTTTGGEAAHALVNRQPWIGGAGTGTVLQRLITHGAWVEPLLAVRAGRAGGG